MNLQLVGCSHHQSSVETREQLAFTRDKLAEALRVVRKRFPETESVLLSTCNRVEFYLASEQPSGCPSHEDMITLLADWHQLDAAKLQSTMFAHSDADAIHHLFMVAASLDSMVLGEAQILSQVKQAFSTAAENQSTGPITHRLFEKANHVAKRVATETAVNRKRVSIPSVAIADCAKQLFETFHDKNVLLLGAGRMGEETLRYLKHEGSCNTVIMNRSRNRAEELAERVGGAVDSWEHLSERLVWADLVVSVTGSREPIVTSKQFRTIAPKRSDRTLLILDLAVPRDFDANIGRFGNVYLYSIDDLKTVCEAHRKERRKEWPKAERIVKEETTRYIAEEAQRAMGPTIRRLKQQAQERKNEELNRLFNKLGGIDQHVRNELERAFERLVNKLLHPPLESLFAEAKQGSDRKLLKALRQLFQISE